MCLGLFVFPFHVFNNKDFSMLEKTLIKFLSKRLEVHIYIFAWFIGHNSSEIMTFRYLDSSICFIGSRCDLILTTYDCIVFVIRVVRGNLDDITVILYLKL